METEFSSECLETLGILSASKNVLISGPLGTGKSRLLGEVAQDRHHTGHAAVKIA